MISLIIPTRNEEGIISDVLQRWKTLLMRIPHEIIVSDGCSTDNTVKLAKPFAVVVLETEPSKRCIARGRNLGAAGAKGEYVVFLDADTEIPHAETFFQRALDLFERDANLLALSVKLRVAPEYETIPDYLVYFLLNTFFIVLNNILGVGAAAGEFQMIRASAFREINGYREDLVAAEDMDIFRRLSRIGRTYIDRSLVAYHSGRRAHKVGWIPLLIQWNLNGLWLFLFNTSYSKEWKSAR